MTVIYNHHGSTRVNAGDMVVIKTNGAISGGRGPYTMTQHWHRDGAPIDGATGKTYNVTEADVGHVLTCVQTATDATKRELVLRPSNQILVGRAKRGERPDRKCPPGTVPHGPKTTRQVVPAVSREKPAPSQSKPDRTQLQGEIKKARGGCRSCAERAKARSRRNNP